MFPWKIVFYHLFNDFIYLVIYAVEETIIYNHGLESRSCFTSITDVSYLQCFNHLRNNTAHFNVIVYKRRFRLCDIHFVSGTPEIKQEPGSILAHYPSIVQMDCLDLFEKGCKEDGLYTIQPVRGFNIQTWCDMKNGGWTVIQRRMDGSENFYRTWTDYVHGFGNRSGEYWLGLENIHGLTKINSSLKIEMGTFEDVLPTNAFAQYLLFKIDDESINFRLHVSGFHGNCGDSLRYQDGCMFSTRDRENDRQKVGHCAQRYKGAWWYNACHQSNLNGLYLSGKHLSYADGVNWNTCWGYYYSLRKTVMKVKRN